MNVDVNSIVNSLLIKYPLFGSVIANTEFVESKNVDTAATDGNSVFYNNEFIDKLNEDQQMFVFAHEICHIAFDHIYRSENKDKRLWNIATDAVINMLLKEDGLEIIDGAVNKPEAINYNAEQMYEKLFKENGSQLESNKKNDNSKVGHDDHGLWDKVIQKNNLNSSESNNQSVKEEHIKKITEAGEQNVFEKNKEARSKKLSELMDSLTKGGTDAGDDTNSIERLIGSIGTSRPLIDWRRALRESLTYDVDWSYKNATVEEGVVTAHLEERSCSVTEIVLDTSGSISETLLKNFLRECKNIILTSRVKVGCFDTKFYGFNEIKNQKDIDNMKFVGAGGTNFDVAVNAFSKRVDNKIIFTDGCASMPSIAIDAIWVVFGNRKIQPKGGKVIYINDKQLKQLKCDDKYKSKGR